MPTTTTNYGLEKPLVDDPTDEDLWGGYLNTDLDDIDTLLKQGITNTVQSSQTTGFTATASISVRNVYPCDATGGAFNATLPAASAAGNGATVYFKKTDSTSNAITVQRAGADTIDGATSKQLTTQNDILGLVSDGTSAWRAIVFPAVSPTTPILRQQVFTSTGANTFTTPSSTVSSTVFKFTIVGGGGAGGGNNFNSAGGGGGATCVAWVSGLSASTGYTCTVGAGGTGSSSNPGASGSSSTVVIGATTYTAGGGTGGGTGTSIGVGGTATNGTINVSGGDGGEGRTSSSVNIGGKGGSSLWGDGGAQPTQPDGAAGRNGKGYGAGGSGSVFTGSNGGSGSNGIIIVEWIL